mmetsp:Transcript_3391/g.4839  ORF Transcript_3391/g.4839 Transcript_3391/m.4839 type:complete len:111 (+) Transcript_3391:11-343(+)
MSSLLSICHHARLKWEMIEEVEHHKEEEVEENHEEGEEEPCPLHWKMFRSGEVGHRMADCKSSRGSRRGRGGGEGTNSFTGRKRRRTSWRWRRGGRVDLLIRHSSKYVYC